MERRDKTFYQELYQEYLDSGLNKSTFALYRGINRYTFYYWCKKLEASGDLPPELNGSFKRISAPAQSDGAVPFLKVTLPSGTSVTFYERIRLEELKGLLAC
jgi:transposase-like protein